MRRFSLDRLLYTAAAANLLLALTGCNLSELLKEATSSTGTDVLSAVPAVAANPGSISGWIQLAAGIATLVAAGVFGPTAAKKVKTFFGKKTD